MHRHQPPVHNDNSGVILNKTPLGREKSPMIKSLAIVPQLERGENVDLQMFHILIHSSHGASVTYSSEYNNSNFTDTGEK